MTGGLWAAVWYPGMSASAIYFPVYDAWRGGALVVKLLNLQPAGGGTFPKIAESGDVVNQQPGFQIIQLRYIIRP